MTLQICRAMQKELIRVLWNASGVIGVIGAGHRGEVGEMIDNPQTCTLTRLASVTPLPFTHQ